MNRHRLDDDLLSIARKQMLNSFLFSELSASELDAVIEHLGYRELAEGQTLFSQDDEAALFFLVHHGQIKLSRLSPQGSEKIIEVLAANSTFAEAIMFSRQHRFPVTATALEPSGVWCIDSEHFASILHQSPDACFAVMSQMSRHLHRLVTDLERLSLHDAASRLGSYLVEQLPNTAEGQASFHLPVSKRVLASRLSVTPETLSRTFNRLCQIGLIAFRGAEIEIPDVDMLRRFANDSVFLDGSVT